MINLPTLPPLPVSLTHLDCSTNYNLTSLPALPDSLTYLDCNTNNNLTALPLLPASLTYLDCHSDHLNSLPTLPAGLVTLICNNQYGTYPDGEIFVLPALPNSLKLLDCSYNNMAALPALPSGLETLGCWVNALTALPTLPAELKRLDFQGNKIPVFPVLPNSIVSLNCGSNLFSNIPVFPDSLISLDCSYSNLSSLPSLPDSLKALNCTHNKLISLPPLPSTLASLRCYNNKLTGLPGLPNSIREISCESNDIYCIPRLPQSIDTIPFGSLFPTLDLSLDAYKVGCLPNIPINLRLQRIDSNGFSTIDHPLPLCTPINNINHCQSFPVIQGNVFGDINSNGSKDANEFYLANINIQLSNGRNAYTDKDGYYAIGIDTGNYTLTVQQPYSYYTANPASVDYHFTTNDTLVTSNIALQPNAFVDSFKISLHEINWAARPGFPFVCLVSYQNAGTTTLSPNVAFNFDNTLFTYDSSSNHSVVYNGASLALTESSMVPGEAHSFYVYLKVKTTATLGELFTNNATISTLNSFTQDSTWGQIRGSFDPNDKQSTPVLSTAQVNSGTFINYTIRFQNTGTDTAFNIVVTDTLSNLLQENTLELINASHPCTITRDGKNLVFEFINILLPDSNVNEPGSHGYINFRIKPKAPLSLNTVINNKGYIYFDYNLPVITNTAQTIVQNNITTPVRLISFYANTLTGGNTGLLWQTANEINTKQYIVQESIDGVNYKDLSVTEAKGIATGTYSTNVLTLNTAVVYYRLKIMDKDGSYYYSSIITLKKRAGNSLLVSNNITGGKMMLNVQDANLVNTSARIINLQGMIVKKIILKKGIQSIETGNLASGNYYLQTQNGTEKITIK